MEKEMGVKDLVAYIKNSGQNSGQYQHLYHFTDRQTSRPLRPAGCYQKNRCERKGGGRRRRRGAMS